jgi:uncharacterized protein YkwD
MGRAVARLVAVVLAAACAAPAASAATNCTPGSGWGTVDRALAAKVLALVNAHRTSLGLKPLSTSVSLTRSAEWKSLHMGHVGYFGHDDPAPPVARSWSQRISDCGYTAGGAEGENIAAGYPTAQDVYDGWITSAGHRENIESAAYTGTGIGVGHVPGSPYGIYWTEDFGTADAGSTAAPPPPAPGGGGSTAPAPPRTAPDRVVVRRRGLLLVRVLKNDRHAPGVRLRVVRVLVSGRVPRGVRVAIARGGGAIALRVRGRVRALLRLRYAVRDGAGRRAAGRATVVLRVR